MTQSKYSYDGTSLLARASRADGMPSQFQILGCTAGKEVRKAIDASGEPPVHQLRDWYNNDDVESSSSADFWRLCEQRDNYRADYNRYWASARGTNSPTRQVDGVIMPVAPTAAVEDGLFKYYCTFGPTQRTSRQWLTWPFSIFWHCQSPRLHCWELSRHFCRPLHRSRNA